MSLLEGPEEPHFQSWALVRANADNNTGGIQHRLYFECFHLQAVMFSLRSAQAPS